MNLNSPENDIIKHTKETQSHMIDLSGIGLTEVPPELFELTHIKQISLSLNSLDKIPSGWHALSQLETLDLSHNQLMIFPEPILEASKLKSLDLSDNQLINISTNIGKLSQLVHLDCHSNQLRALCQEISQLKSLKFLSFNLNKLLDIPAYLQQLKSLQVLSFNQNQITAIPNWIQTLPHLKYLNFNSNPIQYVPPFFSNIIKKIEVDIKDTPISIAPTTYQHRFRASPSISMKSLGISFSDSSVIISCKKIDTIPKFIWKMTHLKQLKIIYTNITEIPDEIACLPQLISLKVYNNKITKISDSISQLSHLETLLLGNNKLTDLPQSLLSLTQLKDLKCHNNQLKIIPDQLFDLPSLKTITLSGNPLTFPPIEIAQKGLNMINIFRESRQKKQPLLPLQQAKIVFVGRGGVGKTSLIKRLTSGKFNKKNTAPTQGITITKWRYQFNNIIYQHRLWDFGGQEIYYKTYPYYLSKSAIFILTWDARNFESISDLSYWLHTISYFSKYSPIFLVQNKCDDADTFINSQELKGTFPNIIGFHKISCKTGDGITTLTQVLKQMISHLPQMGTLWPKKWIQLREKALLLKQPIMTLKEWIKWCQNYHISKKSSSVVLSLFHELGDFLYFPETDGLNQFIILQPHLLSKMTHCLLTNSSLVKTNGICSYDEFTSTILNIVSPLYHEHLLQILIGFHFCSKLSNKKLLIPSLLPSKQVSTQYLDNANLIYKLTYAHLIVDIMSQFIAKYSSLIYMDNLYQNYVQFSYKQSKITISLNQFKKTLIISIQGNRSHEAFNFLQHAFETLHIKQELKSITESIACPCSMCKKRPPHFFNINTLLRYKHYKKTSIVCPNSMDDIDLSFFISSNNTFPIYTPNLTTKLATFSTNFKLTKQESKVLEMVVKGLSNNDIANQLYISTSTVKNHIQAIFKKSTINKRSRLINDVLTR